MNSLAAEIEKYTQENNIPGLCDLVPQIVASKNESHRNQLLESIEGILGVWMYDFHCRKGGDPSTYPYSDGIDALQILTGVDKTIDRVEYILMCGDYRKNADDLDQAQVYYLQSETILKSFMHDQPQNSAGYSSLIYTYENFPTNNAVEADSYLIKALDLAADSFKVSADGFYIANFYLLYRDDEPAHLKQRIQNQRRAFFVECYEKAMKHPMFALKMASEMHRWLSNRQNAVSPEIELEILKILEAATLCATSQEPFDLVSAGHVFSKSGALFKRDDFLLVAESLFSKALTQPDAFSLIYVYIADVKEKRALLLDNSPSSEQAKVLRDEIKNHYLRNWKLYSDDISYLSHATEYLTQSISDIPASQIPKPLLNDICLMGLAAERTGAGHYWYPYSVLFSIYLLMGKDHDAKLWLGRGYRALNILVEDKIKSILVTAIDKKYSNDIISFVQKIVFHLDHHVDKTVWRGGPPHSQVSQMTLAEIESWLTAQ